MKRALLAAVAVALAAGGGAPAKPFDSLLGIVDDNGHARLVGLEPDTLAIVDGRSVALDGWPGSWAFSPNRARLAYVDNEWLRFYDLTSLTREGGVQTFGGGPVAWVDSETVVVVSKVGSNRVEVVKVDAKTHAVLSRKRFVGIVLAARTTPNALVVLLGRENRIAPLRLLVARHNRTRIVRLGDIRGGWAMRRRRQPVVTTRTPGLAVDEARAVVYVADPSGRVVEVPLATLKPTMRVLHGRFAKVPNGSMRIAVSLDNGLLAITGSDWATSRARAAGVELIDTHTWSSRLVEPGATWAWAAGDRLIVAGTSWDPATKTTSSIGLVLLDRSGEVRARLFGNMVVGVTAIVGRRVYVARLGAPAAVAIDVDTGQIVGRAVWPLPRPLVQRSSSEE